MKKVISMILVLALAMSLCAMFTACDGEGGKYVGTYKRDMGIKPYYSGGDNYAAVGELQLNSDKTGTYVIKYDQDVQVYNNLTGSGTVFTARKGQVYASYTCTWEEDDAGIIIYFEGTEHGVYGKEIEQSGSWVAKLTGNRLESVSGNMTSTGAVISGAFIKSK